MSKMLRCRHCGRVVSYRFIHLGLGRWWQETELLPHDDSYLRSVAEHTFPCVGRSLRLKAILADYVALAHMREALLPSPPPPVVPRVG